jgi:hypothetical protein
VNDYLAFGASRACILNLPSRNPADARVVLMGNSHAQMYAPVWEKILAERGEPGLLVPLNNCLPTVSANIDADCVKMARLNLEAVERLPRVETLIIALTWWHDRGGLVDASGKQLDNTRNSALIATIDDLIARLHARGKRVVLVGPIVQPGWDVASELSRELAFGRPVQRPLELPTAEFMRQFGETLRHFSDRRDVSLARPDLVQCDAESCRFVIDGRSLFADSSHLAAAELGRFRPLFEHALAR